MASQLRIFASMETVEDTLALYWGSLSEPTQAVTIAGADFIVRTIDVAAASQVQILNNDGTPLFNLLGLRIRGEGELDVALRADEPTSSTDLKAKGTMVKILEFPTLKPHCPYTFGSAEYLLNADNADLIGLDGSQLPLLWAQVDNVTGYLYRVFVRNRGAAPVTLELILCE